MAALTLALAGRPLGHHVARLSYRLSLPLFASPMYRALLRGTAPQELAAAPPDPWPGDADRGARLLAGSFAFAHEVHLAEGAGIFDVSGASLAWLRELHGFAWLADLRALGGGPARRLARELVGAWCDRFPWWHRRAWAPPV